MSNPCIIVQARTGSTRLPSKILKKVRGRTLLEHLISRLRKAYLIDDIYIATPSSLVSERPIHDICRDLDVNFYLGSETDLLKRYWYGANKYDIDPIIRITSDCPLIDPVVVDETVNLYFTSEVDYFTNVTKMKDYKGSLAYPSGMNVEVISKDLLGRMNLIVEEPELREHVTAALSEVKYSNILNPLIGQLSLNGIYKDVKLSVDTQEDFMYIKDIIEALEPVTYDYGLSDIMAYLRTKDE